VLVLWLVVILGPGQKNSPWPRACTALGVSIEPIQEPSLVQGAWAPSQHSLRERRVESCHRSCDRVDRFELRPTLEPFDAPPGAVPYHRYIEAQNRIDRLTSNQTPARTSRPEASSAAPTEQTSRPEAPRIGDVSPVPEEPVSRPPGEKKVEGISLYREAMTGRLIDVTY